MKCWVSFLTLDWKHSPWGALWHSMFHWKCIWVSQRSSAAPCSPPLSITIMMSQSCSLPPSPVRSRPGPHALSSPVLYHLVLSSPILRLFCPPLFTSLQIAPVSVCWHNLPELSVIGLLIYYSQVKGFESRGCVKGPQCHQSSLTGTLIS